MSNIYRIAISIVTLAVLASCGSQAATPLPATAPTLAPTLEPMSPVNIVRHPKPADFRGFNIHNRPPVYDPNSDEQWQVDLRSADLTKLDLSKSTADLLYANFDSKTQWPPADKMPDDFNWQQIMETGKDPGLGIQTLHEQGITGAGVAIAIIDQPLLIDHVEYKDRILMYEEINVMPDEQASMHGAAVTSIAVGKSTGVAPGAHVYYVGSWTGDWDPDTNEFTWNFTYYAQSVRRILEINKELPEGQKIRVITMQVGWNPNQAGYDEITAAVNEAKEAGILVVSSSLSETYGWNFHGLGRSPLANPNDFWSYQPGLWWQEGFYQRGLVSDTVLVPMDSRTTASPTGTEDYVFYRQGGWSWSIPYLGGMYALAAQVKPEITPEEFWKTALSTGKTIKIQHQEKEYEFGVILDPQMLIEALQGS